MEALKVLWHSLSFLLAILLLALVIIWSNQMVTLIKQERHEVKFQEMREIGKLIHKSEDVKNSVIVESEHEQSSGSQLNI